MLAEATLTQGRADSLARQSMWSESVALGLILILTFIFFTAHGAFSFQSEGSATGLFLPSEAAARNRGIIGYVVIPGAAYSVVLWLILRSWKGVACFIARLRLLALLGVLPLCSAAWSQDPMRSAVFGMLYLVCTLFAYSLVVRFEPNELMVLVSWAGILVCALSLIIVVLLPQYGLVSDMDSRDMGAWNGIFIDRTSAAKEMAFLLTPAIVGWRMHAKASRVLAIVLLSLMIAKTQVVTAFIALLAYVLVVAVLRLNRKIEPKFSLVLLLLAVITFASVVTFAGDVFPTILRDFGRDSTLTGRTFIWRAVVSSILKRPLLGYGFEAFWQGLHGESANVIKALDWTTGYAHNGFLEIWLQLGALGVVIFLASLVQALHNAWFCFRNDRTGRYDWYIGIIALTVVYNIDEATVLFANEFISILYVVACCGLAKGVWQMKRAMYREALGFR